MIPVDHMDLHNTHLKNFYIIICLRDVFSFDLNIFAKNAIISLLTAKINHIIDSNYYIVEGINKKCRIIVKYYLK